MRRTLWDWFYFCSLRNDNPGVYAAGKLLARAQASDPLALYAFLQALGGRHRPAGQRMTASVVSIAQSQAKDDTPPLAQDELDHVLQCFRGLRARRPELAQTQILQHVDVELKRAKRVDDREQFYREVTAGATQLGQIAGAMNLAAPRGDADALMLLADRLDRLQTGRATMAFAAGGFYFAGAARSIGQGMSVCAAEGTCRCAAAARPSAARAATQTGTAIARRGPGRPGAPGRSTGCHQHADLVRRDRPFHQDQLAQAQRIPGRDRDFAAAHGIRALQA